MGMGPLGIGTKYQKQNMIDISVEKAFNMFMEYTHYNVDARLVKRYFEQSGETIEWLEDMGVEFEGAFRYFPKSEATWHIVKTDTGIGPRAASFMNKALYARAQELGIKFLLETPAKKIIKKDGKVAGVLATDKDGKEIEIACKAAIICTGGAGCNKEFIEEETGYKHGVDMFNFAIPGIMGDGLKMAWEAGADKLPVRIEQAKFRDRGRGRSSGKRWKYHEPAKPPCKPAGKRGEREDHMQNTTFPSNVASHQKGKVVISIIDSSIAKYYMKNGVDNVSLVRPDPDVSDFVEGVKMAQANGNEGLFIADSIEELAEMVGIDVDNLVDTVDEYNDFCDSTDEEFFKPKKYMRPLTKAPYYAARIRPGGYGTVGGIRINENCEACDKDFQPVPGLYRGADACNIYDDSHMFLLPGNSMGFAVNTGRIAGMSAAEYVEDED